jgi:signal transduction histidine kinase
VRNAVQASSAGDHVRVNVEVDAGRVRLMVEDHGVGIDEQAKARLFDAFFTTRSQGTGVGLAVVKRIADEHGFAIDVRSSEGQGATFRVALGELQVLEPTTAAVSNGDAPGAPSAVKSVP